MIIQDYIFYTKMNNFYPYGLHDEIETIWKDNLGSVLFELGNSDLFEWEHCPHSEYIFDKDIDECFSKYPW